MAAILGQVAAAVLVAMMVAARVVVERAAADKLAVAWEARSAPDQVEKMEVEEVEVEVAT